MRLLFSESESFYKELDSCVEKGKTTIYFGHEKLGENQNYGQDYVSVKIGHYLKMNLKS